MEAVDEPQAAYGTGRRSWREAHAADVYGIHQPPNGPHRDLLAHSDQIRP
jgi:hypothetical protein